MDIVVQEESSGCGLACVAMLVRKSYEDVRQKANGLGIYAEDEKLWSETNYVRTLLEEYGVNISKGEEKFSSWENLPDTALLSIKYRIENSKPFWHWVVFRRDNKREHVLDPAAYLENNKRSDFENMEPGWFIEVFQ